MRHKHADEIIAWANGAEIQIYVSKRGDWMWVDTCEPMWLESAKYRIKPEPKPDVVELDSRFERADTPRTNAAEHNMGSIVEPHYVVDVEDARDLERELAEAQRNYMDLIMSVGKAYPNETRHETALRYIRERETPSTDAKCSAMKEGGK